MRSLRWYMGALLLLLVTASAPNNSGQSGGADPSDSSDEPRDDKWQFSIGWVHQWGGEMHVHGPSASLVRNIWGSLPGGNGESILSQTLGFHPTEDNVIIPTDDITQYADRSFDDGFVFLDVWTEDPFQPAERIGTTWNWSYDNASQYNSTDLTLSFHRTTTVSDSGQSTDQTVYSDDRSKRDIVRDDDLNASDEITQDGIQFTARRRLKHWDHWDLALDLNFAWFPDSEIDASDTPFDMQVRQDTYRVTENQVSSYSYEATYQETYVYGDRFGRLDPLILALPIVAPAPYSSPGYNGPGPLIPELPEGYSVQTLSFSSSESVISSDRSEELVGSRYWDITDQVDMHADLDRLRFAAGLSLIRAPTNRLQIVVDPKLTLNVVHADVTRQESVLAEDLATGASTVLAETVSDGDKTALVPGFMIALGLDYHLTERWTVGADISHEWLFDTIDINIDPETVSINLDGTELNLHLGRYF